MVLLLPPPVPVNQLAEIGRLLAVFDDELVFEKLLGCGTLQDKKTDCNFFFFFLKRDKKKKKKPKQVMMLLVYRFKMKS